MIDFSGRTAVITGAGSGIGAAVAELFYRLNADLVLIAKTENNVKKIAEGLDSSLEKVDYFSCDVQDEKSLIKVKEQTVGKGKKIDILITCAAAPAISGSSAELSFEDWRSLVGIDLDGVFLSCKTFGKHMIENSFGRIVNLTSFHNIATYPERLAYNAAKSGVEGLTRALAVEWGRYGITVNAVAPGPIRTPRTSWFLSQSPEVEKGMLGRTPNRRIGETDDVASLIAFLASEQARHINGQQIVVDGGWTKSAWWGNYDA